MVTRRQFIVGSTALLASAAGVGAYASLVEPYLLEVVRRRMPVRNLPAELEGATLAHFADTHVGPVRDAFVRDAFATLQAERPDIIVITGDLTATYHAGVVDEVKRTYTNLSHARLATLAVLGNHDYGPEWSDVRHAALVARALGEHGIRVLSNELVSVAGLQIAGMDELWSGRFDPRQALVGLDPDRAMMALTHNPDSADLAGWDGFEGWILAGHTHGGQVSLPFLGPPIVPVENERYTAGEFELSGNRRMYINRGVGYTSLRLRFGARPELTMFELHSA